MSNETPSALVEDEATDARDLAVADAQPSSKDNADAQQQAAEPDAPSERPADDDATATTMTGDVGGADTLVAEADKHDDASSVSHTEPAPAADTTVDAAQPNDAAEAVADTAAEPAEGEPVEAIDERTFQDLGLPKTIRKALTDMGYEHPMAVQLAVYDQMIAGKDIMVQSRTGSGKTAGFGIPTVQLVDGDIAGAQALILAPTRELARQVSRELSSISRHKGLSVVPIYGGAPMKPQIDALRAGAQVIAGTPGRVLDHLRRRTLNGDGIGILVLDECDEMLSMGFQEDIEKIISFLPPREERQTVLFSATIPDDIQRIARRHMVEPEEISLSEDGIGVEEIEHYYYVVNGMARSQDLLKVIKTETPESAIVFCNTREDTNFVNRFLRKHGYDAEALSGELTQSERERVMGRMRKGDLRFLVATDVAARGIDISNLSHVINYAFPESPEVYVHRTGRTGRAGKSGVAISLVGPRELSSFYYLKLIYKIRPTERDLPSKEAMSAILEGERYREVVARVHEEPTAEFRSLAQRVWQSQEGERVVAYLLQQLLTRAVENRPVARRDREDDRERRDSRRDGRDREDDRERRDSRRDGRDRPGRDREGSRERSRDGGRERGRNGYRDDRHRDDDKRSRRTRRDEPRGRAPEDRAESPGDDDRTRSERRERRGGERDGDRSRSREGRNGESRQAPAASADSPDTLSGGKSARMARDSAAASSNQSANSARRSAASESAASESATSEPSAYNANNVEYKAFWEVWADEVAERGADKPTRKPQSATTDHNREKPSAGGGRSRHSVRLFVNIGKREDITAAEIRTLLGESLGDDAAHIGSIALRTNHCYVRVPEDLADQIIDSVTGRKFNDRELVIERARR